MLLHFYKMNGVMSSICHIMYWWIVLSGLINAAIVPASFTSASSVPVSGSSYSATGNSLDISLSFTPSRGTNLTVVNVTGTSFISGRFSNLAHGQRVHLLHNSVVYHFIADYYGGDGNDLVLQWAFRSTHAWGENTIGQLGDNSTTLRRIPVAVQNTGALAGKTPVSVAAGTSHSIVLCADGTIAAWGSNASGQLGNGTFSNSSVPIAITASGILGNKTVIAIAAGGSHSLALCSDGTVATWGLNTNGQLGNNSTSTRSTPGGISSTATLSGKTIVAIAAGLSHSMALCSDGTVATWGLNSNGQLGTGTTTSSSIPVAIFTANLSGRIIRRIATGDFHSMVITADERIALWGSNSNGQQGNGASGTSVPYPTLQLGISGATAASGGGSHTLVRSASASSWGLNSSGQLGNSSTTNSTSPVAITTSGALSGKTITRLDAGGNHCLALCTDGTIAGWGSNSSGQVGNNSTTNATAPIAITTSGTLSGKTPLAIGTGNNHSLAIAAENVTTLTNDAALVTLTSNPGTWSTPFTSGSTNYSIIVPTTTASISFTPRTAHPSATVRVNGTLVTSGTASAAIPLSFGGNSVSIVVTAANGTTTLSYSLYVTRLLPSTNANLASLTLGTGTLSPTFNANTGAFSVSLPESTTSLTLTPTTSESNATLTVNGTPLASGATSAPIPLTLGENRILIRVTAQDGITARTTTLIVFRAVPTASRLTDLSVGSFFLSPAFHPARTRYAVAVPHDTSAISLFPSTLPETTLTVQGSPITHGTNPPPIPLSPGLNLINIRTTSPGGIFTDYQIRVVRSTDIEFTFTSASQTAAEFPAFHATGRNVRLTLSFTPPAGASLTILRLTGLTRVVGRFENLTHGQPISLIYNGTAHSYIADYAGGDGNDLVLHPADRLLLTWGTNDWGQLGIGNSSNATTATPVVTTGVLRGKTVIGVTIGGAHTVAHTSDGTLAAWGQNSLFQLGTGNNTGSNVPVAVLPQPSLAGLPVATRSGGSHTQALCLNGTLASWGLNSSGQFGNGSTTSSNIAVAPTSTGALAGKTILQIATASTGTLALCTDGTLVAWGSNSVGSLGNGTTTSSSVPVLVDMSGYLAGRTVVQIARAESSCFALCSDGALASWGYNDVGQLGNGGTTNATVPTPVDTSGVLAGKSIVQIAAGAAIAYTLCSDGTLAGWGYNFTGQLGDGTKTDRHRPVLIPYTGAFAGKSIASLLVKSGITLVTCTDGTLVKWTNDSPSTLFDTPGIPVGRTIVALDTNNNHHAVIAAAASAPNTREYDLWLARFPTLSDTASLADPDGDGIPNLMESILGGDPSIRSTAILPVPVLSNGTMTTSFQLRTDSLLQNTVLFQYSSQLTTWQDINLNSATDPRITFGPTNTQGLRLVTIALPASDNALFVRLKAIGL